MKRTFLSLLLALSLAAGLLIVPAAAAGSPQLVTSGTAAGTQEIQLTGIPADCQSLQATFTLSDGSATYGFVTDCDLAALPGIYATYQQDGASVTIYVTAKSGVLTTDGTLTLGTLSSADGTTEFTVTGMSGVKLLDSYAGDIELDTSTGGSSGSGSSSVTRSITIKTSGGGSVTASASQAAEGRTITLTATAQEGCALESITVTSASGAAVTLTDAGSGKYTFTMPASAVTVTAVFTAQTNDDTSADTEIPFTDVASGTWYSDAVRYVYEQGLMTGTGNGLFSPDLTTSRAMIVTILYRLEGSPAVSSGAAFDDVADGQWYSDSVAWANANGIVTGYGTGSFGPDDVITREQMATILYRYASYKGYDTTAQAGLGGYTDAGQVSAYALDAMSWAVGSSLITGTSGTTLSPAGSATRAQAAVILARFCQGLTA